MPTYLWLEVPLAAAVVLFSIADYRAARDDRDTPFLTLGVLALVAFFVQLFVVARGARNEVVDLACLVVLVGSGLFVTQAHRIREQRSNTTLADATIGPGPAAPPVVVQNRPEAFLWFSPIAAFVAVLILLWFEELGDVKIFSELSWFLTLVGLLLITAVVWMYFERRRAPDGESYRSVMRRGRVDAAAALRNCRPRS